MGERLPTQRLGTVGETLNVRRESLDSKGVEHCGESKDTKLKLGGREMANWLLGSLMAMAIG